LCFKEARLAGTNRFLVAFDGEAILFFTRDAFSATSSLVIPI
jgi:hypothetical protein